MSSSQFSLATSADLRTTIESGNSVQQDAADQYALSSSPDLGPSTRVRQQCASASNFYEQVDERMSRNSFEYPTYQAKYVDQWLEESNIKNIKTSDERRVPPIANDDDDDDDDDDDESSSLNLHESNLSATLRDQWGKVIGIRGYPKNVRSPVDGLEKSRLRQQYNKLKFDHTRVKSNQDKLKSQICSMAKRFKHLLSKKDHEIELLKELIGRLKGRSGTRLNGYSRRDSLEDEDDLQRQLKELNEKLVDNDTSRLFWQLEQENANLKRDFVEKQTQHEQIIKELKLQVEKCQLEPNQVELLKLRSENNNLKSINERNRLEMQTLRDNYQRLDSELKDILTSQHKHENELGKEASGLSLEVSRLQVYQRKLESILETERAIKQELERQVNESKREQSALKERLSQLNRDLIESESRQERASAGEVKKLQLELMRWQEKCDRLEREKSDLGELLRTARCKVDQLEERSRLEVERSLERDKNELVAVEAELKLSQANCTKLQLALEEATKKLTSCQEERDKLTSENLNLKHEIELKLFDSNSVQLARSRMKESEQQVELLQKKLMECESQRRDLERERDNNLDRIQLGRQQMDQLRERFKLLQETFDKFKVAKEQELARLRVNLNFEHYNRQVAVGSIEKELRHSLRELDTMKCRFIRRFGATSSTTTPPSATTVSSSSKVILQDPAAAAAAATAGLATRKSGQQTAAAAAAAAAARQSDEIRDRRCASRRQQANVIEIGQQQQQRQQQRCRQVNSSFGACSLSSSSCSCSNCTSNKRNNS